MGLKCYHLLFRATDSSRLSDQILFRFAIDSVLNGFAPHDSYVAKCNLLSRGAVWERGTRECVQKLLEFDLNPLQSLVCRSQTFDEFTFKWNSVNSIPTLGVTSMLTSDGIVESGEDVSVSRFQKAGEDSPIRHCMIEIVLQTTWSGEARDRAVKPLTCRLLDLVGSLGSRYLVVSDVLEGLLNNPHGLIGDIASCLGCSPRTLQRSLREQSVNFAVLKRAVHLVSAADLLLDKNRSLAEVALISGFYDQAHFAHALKTSVGMSGIDYRNLVRCS